MNKLRGELQNVLSTNMVMLNLNFGIGIYLTIIFVYVPLCVCALYDVCGLTYGYERDGRFTPMPDRFTYGRIKDPFERLYLF